MCKLLLTVIGHVMACVVDDPQQSPPQQTDCGAPDGNGSGNLGLCFSSTNSAPASSSPRSPVAVLRQALHSIPNQNTEYMLRSVASKLAQNLAEQVCGSGLAFVISCIYSGILSYVILIFLLAAFTDRE